MLLRFLKDLFDFVVPPRRTEFLVRHLTREELMRLGGGEPLPYHDARVTALVWELKYYASPAAAALCAAYLAEVVLAAAAEELGRPLLIPVPMSTERRRERGHNQTEVLCRALIPHLDTAVEYAPTALFRVAHTKTQQGLPKAERVRNVARSMQADPRAVVDRACIVVDDVATTGATLAEAKRALRQAGARVVHTIALARS